MDRDLEIKQGLRDEGGALIGGLVVLDYVQGIEDYCNGAPPPPVSSASYDLGRSRASEDAEHTREVLDAIERRSQESRAAIREILKDRPDILADYDAKMAEIEASRKQ